MTTVTGMSYPPWESHRDEPLGDWARGTGRNLEFSRRPPRWYELAAAVLRWSIGGFVVWVFIWAIMNTQVTG